MVRAPRPLDSWISRHHLRHLRLHLLVGHGHGPALAGGGVGQRRRTELRLGGYGFILKHKRNLFHDTKKMQFLVSFSTFLLSGGRFEDAILLAESGVNVELVFGPLSGTLTLLTLGAGALDRGS